MKPQRKTIQSEREIWNIHWIREPQQDRSAKTRAQLLDATAQLIEQDGLSSLTITRIAEAAGYSVGSVYHHFRDKKAIIYAVLERLSRETALTAEEGLAESRWVGIALIDFLEGFVRFSLKHTKRNPGMRKAQRYLAMEDPAIHARSQKSAKNLREMVMGLLRTRVNEVNHPDPELALGLNLDMLHNMVNQRTEEKRQGGSPTSLRQNEESLLVNSCICQKDTSV
jgi:AcrR family transcriptional regulator